MQGRPKEAWRDDEGHVPAPKPDNEEERLKSLYAFQILDSVPDESIDEITVVLKSLFKVPMVLVSIIDSERQWFKARVGLDAPETPREVSFCAHTLIPDSPEILFVPDAMQDPRFHRNELVLGPPYIRFYCGAPILIEGVRVGALCLIDTLPRVDMTADKAMLLTNFADAVAANLVRSRAGNAPSDLVDHPCMLIDLEGESPEQWQCLYINEKGKALLPGGSSSDALSVSDVVEVGRGEFPSRLLHSQRDRLIAFSGRFLHVAGQPACLCYVHPSSMQMRRGEQQGQEPVSFPYSDYATPMDGSLQLQAPSSSTATTSSQQHSPGRAFLVMKFKSQAAERAMNAESLQRLESDLPNLTSVEEMDLFVRGEHGCPKEGSMGTASSNGGIVLSIALFTSKACRACIAFRSFFVAARLKHNRSVRFAEIDIEASHDLTEMYLGLNFFVPSVLFFDARCHKIAEFHGTSIQQFRIQLEELLHHRAVTAFPLQVSPPERAPSSPAAGDAAPRGWVQSRFSSLTTRTRWFGRDSSNGGSAHCKRDYKCVGPNQSSGETFGIHARVISSEERALLDALSAERAYAQSLKSVLAAVQGGLTDSLSGAQEREALLAKMHMLQRQKSRLAKNRRGRKARPTLSEAESSDDEDKSENDPSPGRQQQGFAFTPTIQKILEPILAPCLVQVYGSRIGRLVEGMKARGLDASIGKTYRVGGDYRLPTVDVANRRGRPVAMLHVVTSCSSTLSIGDWFFNASDSLYPGSIYALISTDETTLELLDIFGHCCQWELETVEVRGCTILIMRKGANSDKALLHQLEDLRAACIDFDKLTRKAG